MKILIVAGARPNFMKVAPFVHELAKYKGRIEWKLVHTGQHYDYQMSKVFFDDFDIPEPDYFLNVGSGSHAEQTGKVMIEFEKVCVNEKPDVVVVVGDVNSTLACAITAKKLNIKVAHIEAGLRSGDLSMPEEINRIVTDSISDYLFVSEKSGIGHLKKEGKNSDQVFFVGNIMIDTLFYGLGKLGKGHSGNGKKYAVMTLHRPSNVDHCEKLKDILEAVVEISAEMEVVFSIHPRTEKNIENFCLREILDSKNIKVKPPLSYLEFLALWKDASLVLTDSGGIQEETTALGIPCFTIRENTERPITIDEGTNILVGTTKEGILKAYQAFRKSQGKVGRRPELWDGKTAQRIVDVILSHVA